MAIIVVGLGPGDPGLLTVKAQAALTGTASVWYRTAHHPVVDALALPRPVSSFDGLEATGAGDERACTAIVERLTALAGDGDVVYAVPGDPLVGDATARALLDRARSGAGPAVQIIHGVSFLEPVCAALELDPLQGLQLVDALDPRLDPARPAIVTQISTSRAASDLKRALLDRYPPDHPVSVVRDAGLPDERVETLRLEEIDRRDDLFADLACLFVPALAPEANLRTFDGLRAISHRLYAPGGCPWDRDQTHASLKPFLLEETYEALVALDDEDPAALREELGDLLLQMTLHTEIAEEAGEFGYGDVFEAINRKLIRRHPHVFGDAVIKDADEQWRTWQAIKRAEKGDRESILAGVPRSMPALAYAQAVQERAARTGFDWPDLDQVLDKLQEELGELRRTETHDERLNEFGDVLFVLANVARWLKLDAEEALRRTNAKFYRRFSGLEALARERGLVLEDLELEQLEGLYQEVKGRE